MIIDSSHGRMKSTTDQDGYIHVSGGVGECTMYIKAKFLRKIHWFEIADLPGLIGLKSKPVGGERHVKFPQGRAQEAQAVRAELLKLVE